MVTNVQRLPEVAPSYELMAQSPDYLRCPEGSTLGLSLVSAGQRAHRDQDWAYLSFP